MTDISDLGKKKPLGQKSSERTKEGLNTPVVQAENMDAKRGSSCCKTSSRSSPGSPSSAGPGDGHAPGGNAFANDGSFLDMFKKKMEEENGGKGSAAGEKKTFSVASFVGKRRGASIALKTGMVAKKQKLETEVETGKGEAWNAYMAEVRKYKAHQCGDDDKTRPLVK